jgi:hypothetical protein
MILSKIPQTSLSTKGSFHKKTNSLSLLHSNINRGSMAAVHSQCVSNAHALPEQKQFATVNTYTGLDHQENRQMNWQLHHVNHNVRRKPFAA